MEVSVRGFVLASYALAAIGICALAACSAYSGAGDDDATPDAGPDAAAAPDAEPGADADANTRADAGPDAQAAPFCESLSPAPVLCADFDEGQPVGAGFDTTPGTVALDPIARSAPFSMLVTNTNENGEASVVRYLGTYASSQTLAFDVLYGNAGGGSPFDGFIARVGINDGARCQFDVTATPARWFIQVTSTDSSDSRTAGPELDFLYLPSNGAWSRVTLTLAAASGQNVSVAVDIDGHAALATTATGCADLAGPAHVEVGASYASPGTARFDDIVFDGK